MPKGKKQKQKPPPPPEEVDLPSDEQPDGDEHFEHDDDAPGQRKRKRPASGFTFGKIQFDIDEILKADESKSKIIDAHRSAVMDKHKAYKLKSQDTNRADLYEGLLTYFISKGLDALKEEKYFKKMDHAVFADVEKLSQSRDFATFSKDIQRKKIAQKLTRNILGSVQERKFTPIVCYLNFLDVLDRSAKKKWTSFVLREPKGGEQGEIINFMKKAKAEVLNGLGELEEDDTKYCAEYAVEDDLVFLGVCYGKEHTTRHKENNRTLSGTVIKRTFVCFVYKLGTNNLYAVGTVSADILKVVVPAFGFGAYTNQSLFGLGLDKMIQANTRKLHKFDMKEMKQKVDDEEKKRAEEGIHAFNPQREKLMALHTALLHDGRDDPNPVKKFQLDFDAPHRTEDNQVDHSKPAACCRTTITLKRGNADEYFAEMYREGFITDITPFLKLKQKRANAMALR